MVFRNWLRKLVASVVAFATISFFPLFSIKASSDEFANVPPPAKDNYYRLSHTSKLQWDKSLQLMPLFMPKEKGIWFEGAFNNREMGIWVSRTKGGKTTLQDVTQSWNSIVKRSESNERVKIKNLGCQKSEKNLLICRRIEFEKQNSNLANLVKMTWNSDRDLIVTRIFAYSTDEDGQALKTQFDDKTNSSFFAELEAKVNLQFNK